MGEQVAYWAHWLLVFLGAFLCVGGTYGVVQEIIDAYALGIIGMFLFRFLRDLAFANSVFLSGGAFSCADNSNST